MLSKELRCWWRCNCNDAAAAAIAAGDIILDSIIADIFWVIIQANGNLISGKLPTCKRIRRNFFLNIF